MNPTATSQAAPPRLFFPNDEQFWNETLRTFGHASYGGSDFGEVVATASQITEGDYESWYKGWKGIGDRIAAEAESYEAKGHLISARDAHLRASTYYREAEFFLHGNPKDPRINDTYFTSIKHFHAAAKLFKPAIEPVEIPYEDTVLYGYFYRAAGSDDGKPRKTMVTHSGFDGSAEEQHYFVAAPGIERGYNVLTFDGPGQPAAVHRGMTFRPDWEKVIGPVLDDLEKRPEVDMKRVALWGTSMGGELAPRAAAFEKRLAALIAVDGVYDAAAPMLALLPGEPAEVTRRLNADADAQYDQILAAGMAHSPMLRWALSHGQYVTGTSTPREAVAAFQKYTLRDGIAEKITCPTLVCKPETDMFYGAGKGHLAQPDLLMAHLTCPKTLVTFTVAEGAGGHCHSGGQRLLAARVFDWLDETFA